jgi:hypothetical protein
VAEYAVILAVVVLLVRSHGATHRHEFNEYILRCWKFNPAITQNPNFLQYVLYRTQGRFVGRYWRFSQPLAMFQRLEDRIRKLCHEAAATPQSPELDEILKDLKAALAEHTRRMRKLAAGFPVMVRPERRCTDMPTPNGIEAKSSYKDQS